MYKTEPHLHVAEISPCAKIGAKDVIKLYSDAGYSTVFITDHLKKPFFEKLGDIPYEEKVAKFMEGYEIARAAGEEYGVNVLFSAEFQFSYLGDHFLLYGIDKEFLLLDEGMFDMTLPEFYAFAKSHGVTVIQAHPYRDGKGLPADPKYIDAVEAFNTNPRHDNHTEKAVAFAKEYDLPMTSGSDTHRDDDVGLGGIITDFEIKCAEDYVRAVMGGNVRFIG